MGTDFKVNVEFPITVGIEDERHDTTYIVPVGSKLSNDAHSSAYILDVRNLEHLLALVKSANGILLMYSRERHNKNQLMLYFTDDRENLTDRSDVWPGWMHVWDMPPLEEAE